MELGLHLTNCALTDPADRIATRLVDVVASAEHNGFSAIAVGDHLWQSPWLGSVEQNMLEAYTWRCGPERRAPKSRCTASISWSICR